jgi:hypothetical protein
MALADLLLLMKLLRPSVLAGTDGTGESRLEMDLPVLLTLLTQQPSLTGSSSAGSAATGTPSPAGDLAVEGCHSTDDSLLLLLLC